MVEYRTWTSIADLPFEVEDNWLPLTKYVEQRHPELGPVATWEKDALVLILADEQPDPAAAAERAASVISEALHACHLSERFPTVFQVEAVSEAVAA